MTRVFKVLGPLATEQYVARRIAAGVHLQVVRSREQAQVDAIAVL